MLTSDDRVWLLLVVRIAIRAVVTATTSKAQAAQAIQEFNSEYKNLTRG